MAASGPRGIVVGVDGSPASDAALAWACAEARRRGCPVVAVHVVDVPYEVSRDPVEDPQSSMDRTGQQVLDDVLARVAVDGVTVEPQLLEGAPSELLLEASATAELVVIGTRRHGGLVALKPGATTHTVVDHAQCPVVVVPAGVEAT